MPPRCREPADLEQHEMAISARQPGDRQPRPEPRLRLVAPADRRERVPIRVFLRAMLRSGSRWIGRRRRALGQHPREVVRIRRRVEPAPEAPHRLEVRIAQLPDGPERWVVQNDHLSWVVVADHDPTRHEGALAQRLGPHHLAPATQGVESDHLPEDTAGRSAPLQCFAGRAIGHRHHRGRARPGVVGDCGHGETHDDGYASADDGLQRVDTPTVSTALSPSWRRLVLLRKRCQVSSPVLQNHPFGCWERGVQDVLIRVVEARRFRPTNERDAQNERSRRELMRGLRAQRGCAEAKAYADQLYQSCHGEVPGQRAWGRMYLRRTWRIDRGVAPLAPFPTPSLSASLLISSNTEYAMPFARIAITLPKEVLAATDRRAKELDRSRSGSGRVPGPDAVIRSLASIPTRTSTNGKEPIAGSRDLCRAQSRQSQIPRHRRHRLYPARLRPRHR